MDIFKRERLKQLQKNIDDVFKLIGETEKILSVTQDPQQKEHYRGQLAGYREDLREYENQYDKLNREVTGAKISVSETPSEKINTTDTPDNKGSPFIVAGRLPHPSKFVGRSRERQTLLDRTHKGLSTALVGDRRIGKTWLLDYLRLVAPDELGSRYRIAYIDASLDSCKTVAGFVYVCLRELGLKTDSNAAELTLIDLENGVRTLHNQNRVPVLCLDEFERFGKINQHEFDLNFFEGLRAIAGIGAAMITASKTPLMQVVSQIGITSPFFNIFEIVRVKSFSDKEANAFTKKYGELATIDQQEQDRILEMGQDPQTRNKYPPLRLQLIGDMLYRDKQLALADDPDLYRPNDPDYWQEFTEILEDKYTGMVQR